MKPTKKVTSSIKLLFGNLLDWWVDNPPLNPLHLPLPHVTGVGVLLPWTCRHDIIIIDTVRSRYNTIVLSKILHSSQAS